MSTDSNYQSSKGSPITSEANTTPVPAPRKLTEYHKNCPIHLDPSRSEPHVGTTSENKEESESDNLEVEEYSSDFLRDLEGFDQISAVVKDIFFQTEKGRLLCVVKF